MNNVEHITVWSIDDKGNAEPVTTGKYDDRTKTVIFKTTDLGKFAVIYVYKTFSDLGNAGWAKDEIEVLAAKGIINTGTDTFMPYKKITRANYLVMLVRTLGLSVDFTDNFDDISPETYYYKEIGIAKKLGVAKGIGQNKYNPNAIITRQDMITLTERALRKLEMIEAQGEISDIERFTDKSLISAYAVDSMASTVKEGLIIGDNCNRLNPLNNTTRAETAVFLYRIHKKY